MISNVPNSTALCVSAHIPQTGCNHLPTPPSQPWSPLIKAHGLVMFPRSLYGCEGYQEGRRYHPVSLTSICPSPDLCSLGTSHSMFDSSMAVPESWMLPRAPSSSKEVFCYNGELDHKNQLDSGMNPEDASMTKAIAAFGDPSHAGGSTLHRHAIMILPPTTTQVLRSLGFVLGWKGGRGHHLLESLRFSES